MATASTTTNKGKVVRLTVLAFVSLLSLRAAFEIAMMREYGPDAQMPIWQMFLIVAIVFWLVAGAIAVGLVMTLWSRPRARFVGIALLLLWVVVICNSTWQYSRGRAALADSRNPATSPERLRALVHFHGVQSGYELDNRLALNPTTPVDALRELSQRRDQAGTLMCLRRNRNTPDDVLQQIPP